MKLRWTAFLVFVFVVSLLCYIRSRAPKSGAVAEWRAAVALPANTRITTNHLESPDFASPALSWTLQAENVFVGKYTKVAIPQGGKVVRTNLASSPNIAKQDGTSLVSIGGINVSELITYLNAGATIYVFQPGITNLHPQKIEAVLGNPEAATLLIRVTNSHAALIQQITNPIVRLASLPE